MKREQLDGEFGGGRPGAMHGGIHGGIHGGMRGGMRAGRGMVKPAVIMALAEAPSAGYDIIKRIEEKSQGLWTPSAGSIYPTLAKLEKEGLVSVAQDGERKIYTLTASGKEKAEKFAQRPGAGFANFNKFPQLMVQMKAMFGEFREMTHYLMKENGDEKVEELITLVKKFREDAASLVYEG